MTISNCISQSIDKILILLKKIYTAATKEMTHFKLKQFEEKLHIHSI
jgi:hypothetical protein